MQPAESCIGSSWVAVVWATYVVRLTVDEGKRNASSNGQPLLKACVLIILSLISRQARRWPSAIWAMAQGPQS
jgi:hypothetical protein